MKRPQVLWGLLALLSQPCSAIDYSWSGYGTAGYTRTDSAYVYERFASRSGSFKRDSILAVQANAEFDQHWNLTIQPVLAPSTRDDQKLEASLPWAFLSYRPSNDLLLRAGKMRMPMYLYSESLNIGVSYDFMHLPTEVYSTAPTNDYTGLSFTKTWGLSAGELSLDGFAGNTKLAIRQTHGQSGDLRTQSGGMMLNLHRDEDIYRIGIQQAYIDISNIGMSSGGAPLNNQLTPKIDTQVYLLGADIALDEHFRLIGELARRHAKNLQTPKNSLGNYLSLQRKSGPWTPYFTIARLLTDQASRQATGFGSHDYDDQGSLSLGTAYALSPNSKLKAEWMRVNVRGGSTLFDRAANGDAINHQSLNLYSLSYNFAF